MALEKIVDLLNHRMAVFQIILTLFFTLPIGSFFNVLIDRIYRGEQFIKGRSYCESCKHTLSLKDLIPIFSYISLKGKCRYCREKIPGFLNITELLTAVTFTTVLFWLTTYSNFALPYSFDIYNYLNAEFIIFSVGLLLFFSFLLLIFLIDLKYQIIPDIFIYAILAIYIIGLVLYKYLGFDFNGYGYILYEPLLIHILSALIMFVFFGVLHILFKGRAMGEGDIYLSAILALFLGFPGTLIMWFTAFLSGAFIGIILILVKSKNLKSRIAFGPFLIIGFIVGMIWGLFLWNLYLALIIQY